MNIVICDICGTLVHENTTRGFLRWLSRRGVRPVSIRGALARPTSWLGAHIGVDISRKWLIWSLRGLDRQRLQTEADAYVADALANKGRQRLLDELRHHRETGGRLILASATLDPVATAFATQLLADATVSSRLAFDEHDRCRGFLSDDLTGRKWSVVEPLLHSRHPAHVVVYTDNREDLDLMRRGDRVFFYGNPTADAERELGPGRLTVRPQEER